MAFGRAPSSSTNQPIVPLADHTPVSLEALMRWRHPQRGLLSPAGFQEGFADQQVRAAFGMYMLKKVFGDVTAFPVVRAPGRPRRAQLDELRFPIRRISGSFFRTQRGDRRPAVQFLRRGDRRHVSGTKSEACPSGAFIVFMKPGSKSPSMISERALPRSRICVSCRSTA